MTTPNQSSVRPADDETVGALSDTLYNSAYFMSYAASWELARAVIASEPWKQLEHEAVGLADRLTEARAERDQAIRERDEARAAVARVEALAKRWAELAPEDDWGDDMASTIQADLGRAVLAALSGGAGEQDKAEEGSDGR